MFHNKYIWKRESKDNIVQSRFFFIVPAQKTSSMFTNNALGTMIDSSFSMTYDLGVVIGDKEQIYAAVIVWSDHRERHDVATSWHKEASAGSIWIRMNGWHVTCPVNYLDLKTVHLPKSALTEKHVLLNILVKLVIFQLVLASEEKKQIVIYSWIQDLE